MGRSRRERAPRNRKRPWIHPEPPCTPGPPRPPRAPRPSGPGCGTGPEPLRLLEKLLKKKR